MNTLKNAKARRLRAIKWLLLPLVIGLLVSAPLEALLPNKALATSTSPSYTELTRIKIYLSFEACSSSQTCTTANHLSGYSIVSKNNQYYIKDSSGNEAMIPNSLKVKVVGSTKQAAPLYIPSSNSTQSGTTNGLESVFVDSNGYSTWPTIATYNGQQYIEYSAYVDVYNPPLANNPTNTGCGPNNNQGSYELVSYTLTGASTSSICQNLDPQASTAQYDSEGIAYVNMPTNSLLAAMQPTTCSKNPDSIPGATTKSCVTWPTGTTTGEGPYNAVVTNPNSTQGTGGGGGVINPPSCQETGGPLSWFTCAVINGIQGAEGWIEKVISALLKTNPIDLSSQDCKKGQVGQNYTACVYSVWSTFRVYGDVLLVIALLIIVYAEASGGGMIDAYTARKVLPRVIAAAILINLSIYIVASLEDITNIVAQGLYHLISAPFQHAGVWHVNITSSTGNIFGSAALLAPFAAGGAIWALHSVGGLGDAMGFLALMVGLPTIIAVLGVLVTIMFRDSLLVLLLMVSPVAFALYCLPNTEQYFKKWWGLLIKTLMVYPIIMGVFALSGLAAVVVSSFGGNLPSNTQWIGELMGILAVAAPLFLIPFAFKMSGGVIGSLHGALMKYGKQAQEAIKGNPNDPNSLRNRTKRNFAIRRTAAGISGAQIGTRLNPRQITSSGRRNARDRLSAQRQVGLSQLQKQVEETGLFRTAANDSNIMGQLAKHKSGSEARAAAATERDNSLARINSDLSSGVITNAEAATQRAEVDRKYNQTGAAIAVAEKIGYNQATRRAAFMNPNFIGYELEGGEQGWNQALSVMEDLSGGDQFQFRSLMDEFQAIAKGPAGRTDLSANTDGKRAYDLDRATTNQSLYQLLNSKPRAVSSLIDEHVKRMNNISAAAAAAKAAGTDISPEQKEEWQRSAVFLTEMRNASIKSQGTGGARDAINARMADMNAQMDSFADFASTDRIKSGEAVTQTAEAVQVTTPATHGAAGGPPVPGSTETRRTIQSVPLTNLDDIHNATKSAVLNDLSRLSRAYTPPNINELQD